MIDEFDAKTNAALEAIEDPALQASMIAGIRANMERGRGGTAIPWCHYTFNPWWGCWKIGPGCKFCYADALDHRWGFNHWGKGADRRHMSEQHWKKPEKWMREALAAGERRRVFCASMGDLFEPRPDLNARRGRTFKLMRATSPALDWLTLTKRLSSVAELAPDDWMRDGWPPHVWSGATVVNDDEAQAFAPIHLSIPARRFLSLEPLLAPVDLGPWLIRGGPGVEWVIVGGESGPQARPFDLRWALDIRDQARAAGIAFFFKQAGDRPVIDGKPLPSMGPMGKAPELWPVELQRQDFPPFYAAV